MVTKRQIQRHFCLLLFYGICLLVLFLFAYKEYKNYSERTMSLANDRVFSSVPYKTDYCVVYDVWRASEEFRSGNHVTLVHHATPKFLAYLKDQLDSWDGGISLSVFIPTPRAVKRDSVLVPEAQIQLQIIVEVLDSMAEERALNRTGLHLFFEKGPYSTCPEFHVPKTLLQTPEMIDLADFAPPAQLYPINPARNIARLGSHTRFFISGDIEQIFVPGAEKQLYNLAVSMLKKASDPIALVYRRFEIDENAPVPKSKKDLKLLLKSKEAVSFHSNIYAVGHNIQNLTEWLSYTPKSNKTTIQMFVPFKNAEWEPQFVADDRAPFHDDRFPFRLRSNTHLGTLMCHMGFNFAVVNDIFTYHRGIKRFTSPSEVALKQISVKNGYKKVVKQYNHEIEEKYPAKKGLCPLLVP